MAKHGKMGKGFAGLHMKTRGVGMSTNLSSRYSKVEAGRRQGYRCECILVRTMALLLQIYVAASCHIAVEMGR